MTSHGNMRRDYHRDRLEEELIDNDWSIQLDRWVKEAAKEGVIEPNAMILATADDQGRPAVRTVLMKDLSRRGISFFTHRHSAKGQQLQANRYAALCFSWPQLERQVTIRGKAEELRGEEVDYYWKSRPRESQLGSAASKQSQVATSRQEIEQAVQDLAEACQEEVPRPPSWTGYRLSPYQVEFWQGGPGRLHDRIRLRLIDGRWVKERLWP